MKRWINALGVLTALTGCAHTKDLPPKESLRLGITVYRATEGNACLQARKHSNMHRYSKAVALFERGNGCSWEKHAASLRNIGRGDQAAELRLDKLLTPTAPPISGEEQATIWLNIGRDYRSVGHFDAAWEAAQMGLSSAPEMTSLRILLAEVALDLGQLDLAEANLAGLPPSGPRYRVAQARLLSAQGRPDLALQDLLLLSERNRERPEVQALRTQLLLQQGRVTEARADVKGHLYTTKSNNHTVLLARRVSYLMHIGERQQARESWLLLQSMAPGAPLYPMAVPVMRSANPW